MAKKEAAEKPLEVESKTEVLHKDKLVNAPPVESTTKKSDVPESGLITFDMYCARAEIPQHHRAGRRAFTNKSTATYEEWVRIFKSY